MKYNILKSSQKTNQSYPVPVLIYLLVHLNINIFNVVSILKILNEEY